ncbi:hypothetical protein HNY73_005944 [Argiope bruennichi]|uniref:Uncharacterized protein n=1 Tax=Argiope bruennichi TaxID=94029 RepID=A0A8T0FIB8_ARGBR|nr:hypothetical protein HNY73_005944 [Argiope bruennichi]
MDEESNGRCFINKLQQIENKLKLSAIKDKILKVVTENMISKVAAAKVQRIDMNIIEILNEISKQIQLLKNFAFELEKISEDISSTMDNLELIHQVSLEEEARTYLHLRNIHTDMIVKISRLILITFNAKELENEYHGNNFPAFSCHQDIIVGQKQFVLSMFPCIEHLTNTNSLVYDLLKYVGRKIPPTRAVAVEDNDFTIRKLKNISIILNKDFNQRYINEDTHGMKFIRDFTILEENLQLSESVIIIFKEFCNDLNIIIEYVMMEGTCNLPRVKTETIYGNLQFIYQDILFKLDWLNAGKSELIKCKEDLIDLEFYEPDSLPDVYLKRIPPVISEMDALIFNFKKHEATASSYIGLLKRRIEIVTSSDV